MAPNLAARRELRGAAGLARNLGYGAGLFTAPSWMPAIFNLGQSSSPLTQAVNRIPGMRANPETDIGRRLGNWLSNEARYFGNQVSRGQTPYAPNAQQQQPLLGRVSAPGTDTGSWRGGAGSSNGARGGGGSPAAERAYQAEASRVAQMAAQNPDLQRYEAARGAAKTQEEMNAVRDEGMRIWAAKHGGLAAKVKPGSTGYEAIQGVVGSSAPSALSSEQVQGLMSFDPNTVLNTTQEVQKQFRPNQALTDQEILNAMSFDPNTAMRSAANMAFAPMSSTEAAMLNAVGGAKGEYITPMAATSPLPPLSTQSAQMLREIGGASGEFITPMNANVGLPGVTDQDASKKLFEELLKRAAQNK